jgi:uncharacterized protein DUF6456
MTRQKSGNRGRPIGAHTSGNAPNKDILHALRKLARMPRGLPAGKDAQSLLQLLQRHDLVVRLEDGNWAISSTGKAWLRRALSGVDPWLAQHQDIGVAIVEVDGVRRSVSVNLNESPLAWLRKRKGQDGKSLLDDAQFAAGERLRMDFTKAQLTPRVTADWSTMARPGSRRNGGSGGQVEMLDSTIAARQRFNRAIKAVGPELSAALIDVCCFLKGLETAERENNWPKRSAKLVLQIALSSLARHYGLVTAQAGQRPIGSRMRHWVTPGYRPEIDPEI